MTPEIGFEDWGTGSYRYQIDCTVNGDTTNFSYGLLDVGTAVGHFARVNTGASAHIGAVVQQTEGAFTGTGLKLATTGATEDFNDGGGRASTDRFACIVAVFRSTNHGNQTITLELNETDDFIDGPFDDFAPPAPFLQQRPKNPKVRI